MNVELTMTNEKGQTICENEPYDFEELRNHPGFSNDERRCFFDLLAGGIGTVEWPRSGGRVRIVRVA